MTPESETELVQDVKIEDAGPARKRLTITIPAEAVDERIEQSMATLISEAAIPGFRKGRAPKALIQKRFGGAVKEETRNQIVADAYAKAIEEHKLNPVGEPEPVTPLDELELAEGKPLTFSLELEIVPEFDLPALDGIEIKKPLLEIADEHIESEVERQGLQLGESEDIDGDFVEGDRIVGYAVATRKGEDEPFFTHDEVIVVHPGDKNDGRGQVLGLLIDDLAKVLKGKKVGDTVIIETTVPEAHEREDIRGKDITIEFQIRQAARITPATVEQVVAHYGMESEQMLREQIRLALEQRRDQEQAAAMREQMYEQLANAVDFELPEKLSASQAARFVKQQELEMLYRGMSPEEVEDQLAEVRAQSMDVARRRLKLFFVLHRMAEKYEIQVSEQEINGRIAMMAAQRSMRPEQLRQQLMQANRIGEIAMQVRDHKTADRAIAECKVTEITAEEWRKLVTEKNKPEDGGEKKAAAKKSGKKSTTRKTTKKKTKKTSTKDE
jgi:trigger factor